MSDMSQPRVLIVAPNASSLFGGEAFLPLKYFQLLKRRGLPATLIAHERNRKDLEHMLAPWREDIHYIEDTVWHRAVWRTGLMFPRRLREIVFGNILNLVNERFQARMIRDLIADGQVDLIHQPIPVSPLAPSSIYGFGVPVVIGPMNGGMTFPEGYDDLEGHSARLMVGLARRLARVANYLIPGKRRAKTLVVANARTRSALPFHDHPSVIELVENGVDLETWQGPSAARKPSTGSKLRLVFMGRLVKWKAIDITLDAIALARRSGVDVSLDILGDGDERVALEAYATKLEIDDQVHFFGFRPQTECANLLQDADALILNSVWECGGAVVLEAMSMGLPVIGPDWGGPADYLDPTCGLLVSPVPRDSFAQRLADAIETLALDPTLRVRLGNAGREKVREEYDWEKKVDQMLEIYRTRFEGK